MAEVTNLAFTSMDYPLSPSFFQLANAKSLFDYTLATKDGNHCRHLISGRQSN